RRCGGDPDRYDRRPHAALGATYGDHPSVAAPLLSRRSRTDGVEQRRGKLLGTGFRREDAAGAGRHRQAQMRTVRIAAHQYRGDAGGSRRQLPDDRRIADDQEGVARGSKTCQRAHRVDLARQLDARCELDGSGQRGRGARSGCDHQGTDGAAAVHICSGARTTSRSELRPSAATSMGTTRSGTRSVATASPSPAEADTTSTSRRTARVRPPRPTVVAYRSARAPDSAPAGIPAAASRRTATSRSPGRPAGWAISATISGAPAGSATAVRAPTALAGSMTAPRTAIDCGTATVARSPARTTAPAAIWLRVTTICTAAGSPCPPPPPPTPASAATTPAATRSMLIQRRRLSAGP